MRTIFALALSIPLLAVALPSLSEEVTDVDRFRLWTGCEPMRLSTEELHDDALAIGLQQDDIIQNVRSRLRAARLYDSDSWFLFSVNVNVVGIAFSIELSLNKVVTDHATDILYVAETWSRSGTGTHRMDAGYILSAVSKYTDEFIDEFFRVNAEACN